LLVTGMPLIYHTMQDLVQKACANTRYSHPNIKKFKPQALKLGKAYVLRLLPGGIRSDWSIGFDIVDQTGVSRIEFKVRIARSDSDMKAEMWCPTTQVSSVEL
jgi:hypothetical protein